MYYIITSCLGEEFIDSKISDYSEAINKAIEIKSKEPGSEVSVFELKGSIEPKSIEYSLVVRSNED